ncbi:hypothetical protein BJ138DRAFT_1154276 [Hygrophoropsis aurantiaca]|uniref:Uncharacterized protein n=1 Tax=Hygrophoropsis aurantiaca TaxID=72124 RepID=A0ACB8A9T8_9AGAM|nr:hypothetical protein BJ138DRAFT_1154276 [Hygrophoropsis aurantiaca]
MKTFLGLPVELLCHVLGELEALDLLAARKTCQVLKQTIDNSEALKYILDMQYYQMVPVPWSKLPVAARRKQLRQREAAWQKLKHRASCKLPLDTLGAVYEFVGGIYADYSGGKIRFFQLPTVEKPEIDVAWTHSTSEWNLVEFTFALAQDLLIIVAESSDLDHHAYDVHIRSLSTNEPHPMAGRTTLQALRKDTVAPAALGLVGLVEVRTHGDYFGLLFRDAVVQPGNDVPETYLQVWNWKKKHYEFLMQFEWGANDFLFLSDDTFLVLNGDPEAHLGLYSFGDLSNQPRIIGRYALPELMDDWYYSYTFASLNPSPSNTVHLPNGVPYGFPQDFYPSTEDQILMFYVEVSRESNEPDAHTLTFVIYRSTLLNLKQIMNDIRPKRSVTAKPVPWSLWGPKYTRWFSEGHNMNWQHSTCGYRTIETINENLGFSPATLRRLKIKDFNPNLLHEGSTGSDGCRLGRLVPSAPTTTLRRPFAEPLGSALAYREVISEEKFEATDVMMGASTVLLCHRGNAADLLGVDILMF